MELTTFKLILLIIAVFMGIPIMIALITNWLWEDSNRKKLKLFTMKINWNNIGIAARWVYAMTISAVYALAVLILLLDLWIVGLLKLIYDPYTNKRYSPKDYYKENLTFTKRLLKLF